MENLKLWLINEVRVQAAKVNLVLSDDDCFEIAKTIIKNNFPTCCLKYLQENFMNH